ncbi:MULTISPECIES: PTS system mannose/fructose/N-acetylgalactosamine-transporter subunit IIB [Staphylococcus intermedius group]|uniref:PTS mannose transporter subunit IIAB n=1 Tax=Staphylococcus delphini TaxID=53344 RepID=A0A2A4GZZ1_9STAP|nr:MULTISPECIES: PTS sugar transporter subunit IIB [Staphylococcus intermedius group]EGQ0362775.1 PTS sugar transporter subunit IIB [Staphylococcus pseudintermedius]EGQ0393789.1 PTS sugar transporter subunit IIB [Staphylococcus pseudintermedius]EGQ1294481.1 PTS mannose transporter subunit IIAB [Staphylococcus pseudintermedius]EGQ1296627.1 PTS mannose transporter subunit IIAB [Staphylococcus pseudintermedius]EGQ1649497.1 PTS mannose/fructose/sorbose transporter subunit IIB [Staphylococcus pseud
MAIIGSRIDGRLIHGQVANLWATKLNIGRFIVIDNEVAQSDIDKQALKLATPAGIKLSVLPVEKAANNINNGKYDSQRVMVIAKRPDRFVELVNNGVKIEELNVGNMSQTNETRSVTNSINITDEDVDNFKLLQEKGVNIISQMVPNDKSVDFMSLIKE